MEKKNVVIYVAGQRFSIATGDTEEYVIGIGQKVDVMIKGIAKDNPRFNRDACAILTALNFCDDETKLRQMMEVLREQVKDYINSNDALRTENSILKEEISRLRKALDEKTENTSEEKEVNETQISVPVPTKSEAVIAAEVQTRHTAFVGKDFKSDRQKHKKNKHKNHHNFVNPAPEVTAPVAVLASAPADAEEAQAEDTSPFHQFSIFDDLP